MIDTDKYEGHRPGPWKIYYDKWNKTGWWIDSIARYNVGEGDTVCHVQGTAQDKDPTAKLIADAPLLLAEVKRLREDNELYLACIHSSYFRDEPGSAMSKLNQMRFLQRSEEE